jgi:hypothetical protein
MKHQTLWTLKRWALTFLVIFAGIQSFRSLVNHMRTSLKTSNMELYITQAALGWTFFAVGLIGALVFAPLIGRTVIRKEILNLKSNPIIQTEQPWLFSGEFPFKFFSVCLFSSIPLSMLTNSACHLLTTFESSQLPLYQLATCQSAFEGVKSLVLGFGAGTALWFIFWAWRMEKVALAPIQVDFFKTKRSSIEFVILATTVGLAIMFKAFIYPIYIIFVTAN